MKTFDDDGNHLRWWTALPALPPGRDALDWWAPSDGRASRYRRLKRVWFDRTWFQRRPKRSHYYHAFARSRTGVHACAALWENFQLFHPSQFVPAIVAAAGIESIGEVADACWSHEFEFQTPDGDTKYADMVLHARAVSGRELVLPIEAKFGKNDRLKPSDADPSLYSRSKPFCDIGRCEVVYLVREKYASEVAERVGRDTSGYGVLTWPALVDLQLELAGRCLPGEAAELVVPVLEHLAAELEIEGSSKKDEALPDPGALETAASGEALPGHLRDWLRGAACFLRAQSGELPAEPPFGYLRDEPTFDSIRELPRELAQGTEERSAELWRIPG